MKRWIFFTVALIGAPALAHAAPSWHGPPCNSFKVCSTDWNRSGWDNVGDDVPCYTSQFANYVPNQVEFALIEVCQRAKVAFDAPLDQRNHVLSQIMTASFDLKDAVADYPNFAADYSDMVKSVAKDYIRLGERMIAYAADDSAENWQNIVSVLDDLEIDSAVTGGR